MVDNHSSLLVNDSRSPQLSSMWTSISRDVDIRYLNHTDLTQDLLVDLNRAYAQKVTPVIVFMALVMTLGLLGNAVVIVVYWTKCNKPMANYFMLYLAILDMLTCLFLHPYVIGKMLHFYNPSQAACKTFEFLLHTGLSMECGVLLCIAIDRYYAVCRPVQFLTSLKRNTWTLAFVLGLAVLVSLPILWTYGNYTISIPRDGLFYGADVHPQHRSSQMINVFVCHNNDEYVKSTFQKAFSTFIIAFMVSLLCTMVVLYSKISYRVLYRKHHEKKGLCQQQQQVAVTPDMSRLVPLITEPYLKTALKEAPCVHGRPPTTTIEHPSAPVIIEDECMRTHSSSDDNISTTCLRRDQHPEDETKRGCAGTPGHKKGLKTAKMLSLVTVVFFLAWLPFWVLKSITIINPAISWESFEHDVTLKLLYHFFYINNAANPIIYTFINRHFKVDVRNFARKHGWCRPCT